MITSNAVVCCLHQFDPLDVIELVLPMVASIHILSYSLFVPLQKLLADVADDGAHPDLTVCKCLPRNRRHITQCSEIRKRSLAAIETRATKCLAPIVLSSKQL